MSSNIEKFILQDPPAFDTAEPSTQIWVKIVRALDGKDALEYFIAEHRALFDTAMPSGRAAQRMQTALAQRDGLERFILLHRSDFDGTEAPIATWQHIEQALKTTSRLEQAPKTTSRLEQFIADNRVAFDTAEPPQVDWVAAAAPLDGIEPTNAQPKPNAKLVQMTWGRQILRAAASIAVVLACFGAGMHYATNNLAKEGMAMSEVSHEYRELEGFYQRDIAGKEEKLAQFAANNEQVLDDLAQVDKTMDDLRKELANVPPSNREQVVRAMINTYKTKAAILEKVLEHIQDKSHQSTPEQLKNSDGHAIKNI